MDVGDEGFWLEADGSFTPCRVTEVVDRDDSLCVFESLEDVSDTWTGFYKYFIPEC